MNLDLDGTKIALPQHAERLRAFLPDVSVLGAHGMIITIATTASPKAIFDAEIAMRKETGVMYELMCGRMQDENKLRVKLAKLRGVGGAT